MISEDKSQQLSVKISVMITFKPCIMLRVKFDPKWFLVKYGNLVKYDFLLILWLFPHLGPWRCMPSLDTLICVWMCMQNLNYDYDVMTYFILRGSCTKPKIILVCHFLIYPLKGYVYMTVMYWKWKCFSFMFLKIFAYICNSAKVTKNTILYTSGQ